MQTYFATIVERDETGQYAAEVIGAGVNGQGHTELAALTDAATGLQEVIWHSVSEGEPLPEPGEPTAEDLARGRLALLQATVPAPAADAA